MAINALTVKRLNKNNQMEASKNSVQTKLPFYYLVYSGILDYRSGNFIRMDPVDTFTTLASARDERSYRLNNPSDNMNACYIVRRYRHGTKQ